MNLKLRTALLIGIFTAPMLANAASFDCAKAASVTEKLICGNPAVSLLDEQLGQAYKQALTNSTDKDSLKQQQIEWLKQQRTCKDAECLTQTYQARIAQLQKGEAAVASTQPTQATPATAKTATKKVSFKITEGQGEPLCEEYLKVLNRTAWDDLQACKLPDLKNSPIQPVDFKPLSGDVLKAMDKLVYERSTHKKDWETVWPTRQHEYEIGYRKLGDALWDLDKDSNVDRIVEMQEPRSICEARTVNEAIQEEQSRDQRWSLMNENEKLMSSKKNGLSTSYFLYRNNKIYFIDAEKFFSYEKNIYSVWQIGVGRKDLIKEWGDKNWVYISTVMPDLHAPTDTYRQAPSDCKFWLK